MITQYIEQYLYQPEVFRKVASAFPNAARGLPEGINPQGLDQAVYEMAKKAYISRKTNSLLNAALASLTEVQ